MQDLVVSAQQYASLTDRRTLAGQPKEWGLYRDSEDAGSLFFAWRNEAGEIMWRAVGWRMPAEEVNRIMAEGEAGRLLEPAADLAEDDIFVEPLDQWPTPWLSKDHFA